MCCLILRYNQPHEGVKTALQEKKRHLQRTYRHGLLGSVPQHGNLCNNPLDHPDACCEPPLLGLLIDGDWCSVEVDGDCCGFMVDLNRIGGVDQWRSVDDQDALVILEKFAPWSPAWLKGDKSPTHPHSGIGFLLIDSSLRKVNVNERRGSPMHHSIVTTVVFVVLHKRELFSSETEAPFQHVHVTLISRQPSFFLLHPYSICLSTKMAFCCFGKKVYRKCMCR